MLSGVTSLSSPMTPSTSELKFTLVGKPHRGFQPRRTDRHRARSRRRPRSYRAFGSPTYEVTSNRWDQQNRLVRMLEGTHESVYEYDGESRRVRIKELTSSVETKNETFVWCGSRICQKRASNGSTVERNYFKQGFEEGTTDYFYTRDHLGSVREVVGSDGTTIASRVSYDPWGKVTESGSGALSDFTYTGHYYDRPTGLGLTWYRGYEPNLGRWLSQDPIGLKGGLNLYGYVHNNPVNLTDPKGLAVYQCTRWIRGWASFARHRYMCVEMNGQSICYGHGGEPEYDVLDSTNCELVSDGNSCMDECMTGFMGVDAPPYSFWTNNCYQYASRTLNECTKRCFGAP